VSIFDAEVTIPAGQHGLAKVERFEITEEDSRLSAIRSVNHPGEYVRPGKYVKLFVGNTLMMSDTTMERRTNHAFVCHAHGRVLIAGLGIGLILEAILDKPEVETVTVIEKYRDVVTLVGQHYQDKYRDKLTVITADIFKWRPIPRCMKYNVIYFDIWPDICCGSLKDMAKLHMTFSHHLDRSDPFCWMDSWQREYLKALKRHNDRYGW